MNFSNLVIFFVLTTLFIYSDNHTKEQSNNNYIIYLKGTCSSGKSTIIRSMLMQWENLEIVDEDSIMQQSYVEAVAIRYPHEYACIKQAILQENLYHALREKDILFKKTATKEECAIATNALYSIQEELNKPENLLWKQEVSKGIDTEVLRRIRETIEQKKNVLLDSWYIKPHHLNVHFPETKIIRILIYSPLSTAYERLLKRNNEALIQENLSEKRYLRQLIGSFFSLYQIDTHPLQPIQEIKKDELDQVLDVISQSFKGFSLSYHKPIFTFEEISQAHFLKMRNDFLRPFEKSGKVFYISPKEKQDIIIDNTTNGIQKALNSIKESFDQQQFTVHLERQKFLCKMLLINLEQQLKVG